MRISRAVAPSPLTTTRSYSWWILLSSPILETFFPCGRQLADGLGWRRPAASPRGALRASCPDSARPITSNMRGPRLEGVERSPQPGPLCGAVSLPSPATDASRSPSGIQAGQRDEAQFGAVLVALREQQVVVRRAFWRRAA